MWESVSIVSYINYIYILKINFINKEYILVILPNVRCSILRKSFNKVFKQVFEYISYIHH
jgi:hypothetical protein